MRQRVCPPPTLRADIKLFQALTTAAAFFYNKVRGVAGTCATLHQCARPQPVSNTVKLWLLVGFILVGNGMLALLHKRVASIELGVRGHQQT
jgi:hypothetical protein